MKHRRFKYFSKLEHAEAFLDGKVLCRTAAFFRDYEDAHRRQIIGDEYEGTRLYRPLTGLEISNLTRGQSFTLHEGMECQTKAHEIYVFCMSNTCSDELKSEFGATAYAEITDPREFIGRWHNALPEEAQKKEKHVARKVGYYKAEDLPGNVWALPDLITTTKLKQFQYQDEYRLAFTTTDAFAFENCKYQIVDRKVRPSPRPDEPPLSDARVGKPSAIFAKSIRSRVVMFPTDPRQTDRENLCRDSRECILFTAPE